jgi:hypothetical protein
MSSDEASPRVLCKSSVRYVAFLRECSPPPDTTGIKGVATQDSSPMGTDGLGPGTDTPTWAASYIPAKGTTPVGSPAWQVGRTLTATASRHLLACPAARAL